MSGGRAYADHVSGDLLRNSLTQVAAKWMLIAYMEIFFKVISHEWCRAGVDRMS